MEVEILRDQLIGLVQPRTSRHGLVARLLDDRAKTGVLEEVPPKRIAGTGERLVAGRDPRAPLDEVVAAVERGHREVVVERMHLEALEGHDGGPCPLPDIADHVAEISLLAGVHRAARSEAFQVDVARRRGPRGLIPGDGITEDLPVGLGRQEDVLARPAREPRAVGLSLQTVDFDRPVERERDLLEKISLEIPAAAGPPELWMLGPRVVQPALTLLRPPGVVAIASIGHERQEVRVRDQPLSRPEGREVNILDAVLVVPAVGAVGRWLAQPHVGGRQAEPLILRGWSACRARAPESPLLGREFVAVPEFRERHLPHDHARCLEVDPLVLDAHQDHPRR